MGFHFRENVGSEKNKSSTGTSGYGGIRLRSSRRRRRPRRKRCGWPASCPRTCRCRCTTSRRTPRTRSRPASSTRNLQAHRKTEHGQVQEMVSKPIPASHAERAVLSVPGGVAQQRLRSSTCSTSRPRSHAPSDTSSFANRCRIGLRRFRHTWVVTIISHLHRRAFSCERDSIASRRRSVR